MRIQINEEIVSDQASANASVTGADHARIAVGSRICRRQRERNTCTMVEGFRTLEYLRSSVGVGESK